jgi:hypothetical protein
VIPVQKHYVRWLTCLCWCCSLTVWPCFCAGMDHRDRQVGVLWDYGSFMGLWRHGRTITA